MAMNPYLANLMQRIGPALERMPQLGQNTQFASQRPPPQGLFGPGMVPPTSRQLPMLPQIAQAMPRRRFQGSGMMPRMDLSQLTQAFQAAQAQGAGNPLFAAPPSPGTPAPVAAPAAPVAPPPRMVFDSGAGMYIPAQAEGGGSGWYPGLMTTT